MTFILKVLSILLICMSSAFAAINVNTATESELTGLPGIGPSKAAAIIEFRSTNGNFGSIDDLAKVNGIGAKTVAGLRSEATTGEGSPTAEKGTKTTPPVSSGSGTIDINIASSTELQKFNGVGPLKAARDYRN